MQNSTPKVLFLDIEASALEAVFGRMLCVGYRWEGEKKIYCPSLADFPKLHKKDPTDDTELCKEITKVLTQADVVVTWYGRRYDIPFIQSRCLANNLPPIPDLTQIDLWETARSKLKLYSNRLAVVQGFLELPEEKTPIEAKHWVRAKCGFKEDLNYVIKHCVADIEILEQAYEKMKPLIRPCPALYLPKKIGTEEIACIKCGATHVHKHGMYVCSTRRYIRLQCQKCGAWFKGPWIKD